MGEPMKITIPGTLPSLNEMVNKSKANKYEYVTMKNRAIKTVAIATRQALHQVVYFMPEPADFEITWYCPNKKRDKDNVASGVKYILDGLQEIGLLKNDGWKEIGNISHRFEVDKHNPRIEVIIKELTA